MVRARREDYKCLVKLVCHALELWLRHISGNKYGHFRDDARSPSRERENAVQVFSLDKGNPVGFTLAKPIPGKSRLAKPNPSQPRLAKRLHGKRARGKEPQPPVIARRSHSSDTPAWHALLSITRLDGPILSVWTPDVDALLGGEIHAVALLDAETVVNRVEHLRIHVDALVV